MLIGIILGLCAAFCQTLSYLGTRHFVQPRAAAGEQGAAKTLLVLSHVWMGAASLILLPALWPYGRSVPWKDLADPVFFAAFYYAFGQIGLMMALRYAQPSRVSPMLAFKLVVLACLASAAPHLRYIPGLSGFDAAPLARLQWVAVALAVVGAMALNYTGGALHKRAGFGLVLACVAYSLSDWNIGRSVRAMGQMHLPAFQQFAVPALLCYAFCGLCVVPLLPWRGSRSKKDWVDAAPFAGAWFVAMLFLFSCFGVVGVVLGNILQSSRGLMSVVLGVVLAHLGHHHLESHTSRGVLVRRIAAAVLMLLAVILYAVG
jgi:hypothetical protein